MKPGWLTSFVIGRNPRMTFVRIGILIAVVVLVRAYWILPIQVNGPSMLPTYSENGINFVNRLAYARTEPQRFDVIAIRTSGDHILYMKRILALPGETISFENGRVHINGEPLNEPYMNFEKYPCDWEYGPAKLEPNHFFVVGDNRTMQQERHSFGIIARERIIGKVMLCKNLFASSASRR